MSKIKKDMNFLNQWKVDVLHLRQFLASINNDGATEIGVGDLLIVSKSLARLDVTPLKIPSDP